MNWLKTYYPFEQSNREKWNTIIILSFFCSVSLFMLQPFGFTPKSKLLMGYLVIGFTTLLVNYFSIPRFAPDLFDDNKWSIFKAILFFAFNFIVIGLWIHVFNAFFIINDPSSLILWIELFFTVSKILVLGLFASAFLILIRYNIITRRHLQISQELNQNLQSDSTKEKSSSTAVELVHLNVENKTIKIPRKDLFYISAEGNYISFHQVNSDTNIPKLLRARLKDMEDQLSAYPEYFRCHRSFIINVHQIDSTQGNSQGLTVKYKNYPKYIPIARSKIRVLRSLLDQTNN